jgi:hypothetical protein
MSLSGKAIITIVVALRVVPCIAAGHKEQDCRRPVIELLLIGPHPVVDCVLLNGQGPFRFLIDTGAQANMLDPKVAQSAGLRSSSEARMVSAAGAATVAAADDLEVALGSVKADHQHFLFGGMETIRRLIPGIQGVIGQDFLSHFDYLLDFQNRRLKFGKAERAGTRVKIQTVHGVPALSTSLGLLLLDSGAPQLMLFGRNTGERFEKLGLVTGSVDTTPGIFEPLVIEGRTIRYPKAVITPSSIKNVEAAGLLPTNLFKAVYVCNSGAYAVLD